MRAPPPDSQPRFRLWLALAVVLVMAFCWGLYEREANQIESSNLERESRRAQMYSSLFNNELKVAVNDLRLLSSGDGLKAYLTSHDPAQLQRAVDRAVFVSKDNPDYDQIRYLDQTGQEIFRVDENGQVAPQGRLQNKAARSFFQQASQLAPGGIYISAIDLDVENNTFVRPLRPTVRFAMPLFDSGGQRRGIYLINYLVESSVERLRQFLPAYAGRLRLLNSDGYWLAGAQPDEEWGFLLPGRGDRTLAKTDPGVWAQVEGAPEGQVPFRGGYFSWHRYVSTNIADGRPLTIVPGEKFIIFASVVNAQEWAASLRQLRETFAIVAFMLLVLVVIGGFFLQARRQARIERDRFFTLTRDLLCTLALDGRFRRVNPAWEETLGYANEDLLGQSSLDFIHDEDRAAWRAQLDRLAKGSDLASLENRFRARDGTYRQLLWSARAVTGGGRIYASARDMTGSRLTEEKLRQADERSRLMIESVQDYAMFMLAPDGRVMSWNPGAERIKGYAADEIIGQHFSRFYPPEKIAEGFPDFELREAARTGRFEDENWRVRKDGSRFWANVVITAMRGEKGELLGFAKVTRDMTLRRQAAERIERLNEQLKSRADQLEEANKELEAFSFSVSHDLRAPLRHIGGFVELLQSSPVATADPEAMHFMNVIAKSAKEMGQLIDDLLSFSRASRAEMHTVTVPMTDLVNKAIRGLEMETKGRTIAWDIHPLPEVEGDPGLLRQVWANLLGNAVKYTRPRPEARIEIGEGDAGPANGTAGAATFYVRDNGVGFDMQYASKLFGVFQRMHRAEDFEGTGIGLANVQKIIQRHGGRIWVEAKPDVGATFFFTLPIKTSKQADS